MATPTGKVYVFNCFNEPASLSVSNFGPESIPAWAMTGTNKYEPSGVAVARIMHGDEREGIAFANVGDNLVSVNWTSNAFNNISIPMPPGTQTSINDDLVLYLTQSSFILMTTDGYIVSITPTATKQ